MQLLNRMLELRHHLLPPLLENDEEKVLNSCLVNEDCQSHGLDEVRSCKVICNCIIKACTIMHPCKAANKVTWAAQLWLQFQWGLQGGLGRSSYTALNDQPWVNAPITTKVGLHSLCWLAPKILSPLLWQGGRARPLLYSFLKLLPKSQPWNSTSWC